jgi:hypothetical protein
MDGRAVIRHSTWKKNVLVQVRYLIQVLHKTDLGEMIVNGIQQVCHMKMAVHYAVMVRCNLKRYDGFTGSTLLSFYEVERCKFIVTVCGSDRQKGRDFQSSPCC